MWVPCWLYNILHGRMLCASRVPGRVDGARDPRRTTAQDEVAWTGLMFWFTRNTLFGSYFAFNVDSRS